MTATGADPDGTLAFSAPTRAWFDSTFGAPTAVQRRGWRAIAAGRHALLLAPTGSGKTLAAFLSCLDRLARLPAGGIRVVYVSPLKALVYDIERNLRVPLLGIRAAAERLGLPLRPVEVSVRTGDTPARDRRRLLRAPGDILVTTPESLYLLLGSSARLLLRGVDTVIVDEIHALAASKRGAHLALSLERLSAIALRDPQRIGLSATQRPLDEVARFLGGDRPVTIVDASEPPRLDLVIEVPLDDMEHPPAPPPPLAAPPAGARLSDGSESRGTWAAIHPRLLELVRAHRSTIVFVNSRRLCERLAQRLNELARELPGDVAGELAGEPLVRAHHGSVAPAQREEIEESLKQGRLRGIIATSSLELGIDMAAVDLVLQIESPGSVARGLQRVGRAGHQVGARSVGRIFPKFRGDLLEAAVVARGMLDGDVESTRVPRAPLDVLAQQLVALCALGPIPDAHAAPAGRDDTGADAGVSSDPDAEAAVAAAAAAAAAPAYTVGALERIVRRAYSYQGLPRVVLESVLDMLSGRYPSDELASLRPRLVWDRARDRVTGRADARIVALTSGGTIPDRGTYAVHLGAAGPRLGELDEEMVHESRVGQTFLLGASTWRIAEITRDRVIVTPAPGEPGRMPFWRGESAGRPIELGRALGAFLRALVALDEPAALAWLSRDYHLDERAARNLHRYVAEQRAATAVVPTDRTIVIERFRDELGDLRVCLLSPFGARVHAPWALALEAGLRRRGLHDASLQLLWSDDGIVLRIPDGDDGGAGLLDRLRGAALLPAPEDLEDLVVEELGRSSLFATRFRENAARALLLPRRTAGKRTPLWAQRLRAQNLLAVASRYPSFPIVVETFRECLHDVFDLPSLRELLGAARRGEVAVVEAETATPSPFARSLVFAWVATYLYAGDAPPAERRAQALAIDRDLLRALVGEDALAELLDPAVIAEVEAELQCRAADRRARHADGLHDLLRRLGELDERELAERATHPPAPWLAALADAGRAVRVRIGAVPRWVAIEDVGRYRDALGVAPPTPLPPSLAMATSAPLESLVARWARTHGPFAVAPLADRLGVAHGVIAAVLAALAATGRLIEGRFSTADPGLRWVDAEVLGQLRRRVLARLRQQVAPVDAAVLARFLPRWHGISDARGPTGALAAAPARASGEVALQRLRDALVRLEGLPLPLSDLESAVLPARVPGFHARMLDELGALGEVVWVGCGALGDDDGRVALYRRAQVPALLPAPPAPAAPGPIERAILDHLAARGASFAAQLPAAGDESALLAALLTLVWQGLVTNDTFAPLRTLSAARRVGRSALAARRAALGGRWSLVEELRGRSPPGATESAHATACVLLARYGVVSRDAAQAETLAGGFAAVAPVLRVMEEAGRVRRGYFVEGLGGLQYADPDAVERLRAARVPAQRAEEEVLALAAVDPANPYGALLPWPGPVGSIEPGAPGGPGEPGRPGAVGETGDGGFRPRRVAGARVVLVGGAPVFYLDPGGRHLRCFGGGSDGSDGSDGGDGGDGGDGSDGGDGGVFEAAIVGLRRLAAARPHGELRLETVDGVMALRSARAALLKRGGFRVEPGRLVLGA